jgi:hypothetical protein
MKPLFAIMAVIATSAAHASTFTGQLVQVLAQVSPTTAGNTRVSIQIGTTTSCSGNPGWYSFDMPSSSAGSMWEATLLAAITAGNEVTINGSGTCDPYGLEIVSSIAALPPQT